MKKIPLTQRMYAVVDDEDYEKLSKYRWCVLKGKHTFYAVRASECQGKYIMYLMHREILGLNKGDKKSIDHINRDGLDNRKENLRLATQSINNHNSKTQRNNTSGYRGVSWRKDRHKWKACFNMNGKQVHLGYYKNPIDAARAYNQAVSIHRDRFASLNKGV